jgi:membrane protein DedA with SNARE-associated domain
MLEIIILFRLATRVGAIVREKGHSAFWFQFLLVVLWFGGELGGAVVGTLIGMILENGSEAPFLFVYLFALLGAVLGAVITFQIAKRMTPAFPEPFAVRDEYASQEYFGERRPNATGEAHDHIQRPRDDSCRT